MHMFWICVKTDGDGKTIIVYLWSTSAAFLSTCDVLSYNFTITSFTDFSFGIVTFGFTVLVFFQFLFVTSFFLLFCALKMWIRSVAICLSPVHKPANHVGFSNGLSQSSRFVALTTRIVALGTRLGRLSFPFPLPNLLPAHSLNSRNAG